MMTTYEFTVTATCPANGSRDEYKFTMDFAGMLRVEGIFDTISLLTAQPIYQEHLTQKIHDAFEAQQTVSVGTHSGVKTTCICL